MKNKNMSRYFVLLMTLMIFLLSGSSGSVLNMKSKTTPDIVAGYQFIIDQLIASNSNLTEGIEYLAIDTTNIQGISPDEQAKLLQSLNQYHWTVLNKTYSQLESEGLIKDLYFEKCVLITIKDVRISGSKMTVNVSLFRGGLAAYGYDDMEIVYDKGQWSISNTGETWVA